MGYLAVFSIVITSILCYTTAYHPSQCDYSDTYYNVFKIGQHDCDCQVKHAGQLKFDEGKVLVCDGKKWNVLQFAEYGTKTNAGVSCEDIRSSSAKQLANGVYWIALGDNRESFPVYCDMGATAVNVPDPIAHYPLNSRYATREIKNRQPQGTAVGVHLEAGPDGKAGGSYQFEGKADSYIEFPNNGGLDAQYSMTMLCWVYPQNLEGPIFNYKTSGQWGVHMWMVAGKLFARFNHRNYTFTPHLLSNHLLPLNQWYYVGASYDHNTGIAKLWLNGQQVLQLHIGAKIILGTQDSVRMGAKGGDGRYLKGRVTDMKIYDVALTMEQINAVKHANQGWTMVFKAVTGVNQRVFDTYNSPHTSSEDVLDALDATNRHPFHYKNRIVLNWGDFDPSEARVVLYTGGKLVKELKFNAHGSDKLNWFSNPKLTYSSWINIKTEPNNVFSIAGLSERHFFINRSYGGCPHDYGWLAVTGWHCDWEKHYLPLKNVVIYCKSPSYTNWKNYNEVGVADVLVVYVR